VLDFGISKALKSQSGSAGASPSLTAAQSFLGSPAYMSPEQARRPKTVDTRTDIWALGVILYEFLGGETPFVGDVPLEVLTAAASDPMPSLRETRKDVPVELESVIRKCLEKKADDRYQSVADFAEALRPFAPVESRRSISRIAGILRTSLAPQDPSSTTLKSSSPPAPADTADTEAAPASPLSPSQARDRDKDTQMDWGKSQSGTRRSRRTLVLALGGLVALVLVGLGLHGLGSRPNVPPSPQGERAQAAQPSVPVQPSAPAPVAVLPPVTAATSAAAPAPRASAVASSSASAAPVAVQKAAPGAAPAGKARGPAATKSRGAAPAAPGDDEDPLANRR